MNIEIKYSAQLKQSLGREGETLAFPGPTNLQAAIRAVADQYGEEFSAFVFDENGDFSQAVLLAVNGEQIFWSDNPTLNDNDTLDIMAPMSGG